MKLLRFRSDGETHYGVLVGDLVHRAVGDALGSRVPADLVGPLTDVRVLAPCVPSKILAVGLNYENPEQEGATAFPDQPIVSLKPPSAVVGPEDPIVWPSMSQRVDYEGEVALVIGQMARAVSSERAAPYILGVTCANDVTARDIQRREGHWAKAKGFDTFCPLGPFIETDLDLGELQLTTRVSGEVRQSASTSQLYYDAARLVSYISSIMTLYPGDVILTGTPQGFGPLRVGDTVEVSVSGVGTLRSPVVGEG
ncbi:MAG TPA: fumarylacetoacetate hydrolase family protein [Chloroflexota bacterium]|nr:fumarylacetoacetate hydrolase family protein [Chloroflexota bacterium]